VGDAGDDIVRAAGTVVWRRRDDGETAFLLVHRREYDDWSFPKGKNAPGEPDDVCALRETVEETGLAVSLGPELASTAYVSKGRPKRVRYWLARTAEPDAARPQNEVDRLTWATREEAGGLLSYERDRAVLESAVAALDAARR
jgi:8-oxo-dGTP diphosphatase